MKRHIGLAVLCAAVFLLTSCATSMPVGSIYTELKLPVTATGADTGRNMKVGKAQCTSILAMVAIGDASIETAKQNGKITRVSHVDWDVKNIMGIIGTYTVTVYGQ